MALDTKQVALCLKKVFRTSIRKGYRCVSEHLILLSFGGVLYLLYRSLPGLFAFLLSSSPVIICTTLLLGILLSYGDTDYSEANEDNKTTPEISAFKVGNSSSDIHFEANQRFPVPELRKYTGNFKERETNLQTIFISERASEHVEPDEDVPLLRSVDQEHERFDRRDIPTTLTPCPSMVNFRQDAEVGDGLNSNQKIESKDSFFMKDEANRDTSPFDGFLSGLNEKDAYFGMFSTSKNFNERDEIDRKLNQQRFADSTANKMREISEEKPIEGVFETSKAACSISMHLREYPDELKINTGKAIEDNLLDSSLGSPWERVGSDDGSSGFDSDQAESSSPDASMTDIAPILDEIDPLLGASSTRPDPIPKDDSDTGSHVSSQDHQTDDDSNDEADDNDTTDNAEEKNKGEVKETAFIWTADDEKNLMDLGYSEMERNRRLEILMSRRRSRKNIRFEMDNNLIDADSNGAGRSSDDFSRFRAQVPRIAVPRRNPFDLPYDSEEAAIPGSAPSVLHTRKNPFEFPPEKSNDSGISAHDSSSPGESVATPQRDMFFRRHESFNIGRTDATQERWSSRFKPYFVPETVEGNTSNFQRQFSDKSESKLSSLTESDMASSVADQEDHKDLNEKDLHSVDESPTLQRQDSDLADVGSECSDGINSVDVELDNSDIDDREITLQHFVFERSQEREAYLTSTKGKGHEGEDYMLKSAGNSTKLLHPVTGLLSWEGIGESSLGAESSHNTAVEFSEWVSSPRPTAEHESGSGNLQDYLDTAVSASSNTIVLGARNLADNDGNVDFMSYSNDEMPSESLIQGSMEVPSEFSTETLPVISRDLHPIPEERVVENFNVQEMHGAAIFTDSATALTGLHVIEEHFDVECEARLSSAAVSSFPRTSYSIQSPLFEAEGISSPFIFMAAEPNKLDMVDLNEETTAGYPLDSDDDADKIYPEPTEDNVIDEDFLSELDAVGDFGVEAVRLEQHVPDIGSHIDRSLISPQTSGNISTTPDTSALEHGDQSPLSDDLNGTSLEFGWSLGASYDDPELTVYNPRRRILQADPFEEMTTETKSLSAANAGVGSSELDAAKNESELTKADAEMVVLDAKSPEDIVTTSRQASDDVVDSTLDSEASHVSSVHIDSEPVEDAGQLVVIDAQSVDDIYAAFDKHSCAVVNSSLEENEGKDGCGETADFKKHDKLPEGTHVENVHIVGDGREPEPMATTSNMDFIETKTLDDIDTVFMELSDAGAKSTVDAVESENACEGREDSEQHPMSSQD